MCVYVYPYRLPQNNYKTPFWSGDIRSKELQAYVKISVTSQFDSLFLDAFYRSFKFSPLSFLSIGKFILYDISLHTKGKSFLH